MPSKDPDTKRATQRRFDASRHYIHLRLDPEEFEQLTREAQQQGRARTTLVREFVTWGLEELGGGT